MTTNSAEIKILENTKLFLHDVKNWRQVGNYDGDKTPEATCMMLAINDELYKEYPGSSWPNSGNIKNKIVAALGFKHFCDGYAFNDASTHEQVLAKLDEAINNLRVV